MHPTNRLKLDIPDVTDAVSLGPSDFLEAFNILDAAGVVYEGIEAARPFAGTYGTFWYSTDTNSLYFDTGAAWMTLSSPLSGTPIGAQMPYAGVGDPTSGTGVWVVADGRLIDKTTYFTFYSLVGNAYNGGSDPGSNKVRVPDKRGKKSVGSINMGSAAGAGLNDNTHFQGARGTSYGEVSHRLITSELASHQHGVDAPGVTGGYRQDHTHYGYSFAPAEDIQSGQYQNAPGQSGPAPAWGPYALNHGDVWGSDFIGFFEGNLVQTIGATGVTGGQTGGHDHLIGPSGSDALHNNIDPCETDTWIVRIA